MSLSNDLSFDMISTPIGVLTYFWNELGIHRIQIQKAAPRGKKRPFFDLGHQLSAHFDGKKTDFTHYPLYMADLTPFEKEVLNLVRTIPYGQTYSYKQVAMLLGRPMASQAIGQALKKNPFPILIPCHRVKETKKIGGYSFGEGASDKFFLLELERGQQYLL